LGDRAGFQHTLATGNYPKSRENHIHQLKALSPPCNGGGLEEAFGSDGSQNIRAAAENPLSDGAAETF
jgi:hypothetical protein